MTEPSGVNTTDPTVTLCLAVALGVSLIVAAKHLKVPSPVLLLAGGVILGPEVLGWIDVASLGSGLHTLIGLAVAIVVFELGLTLDVDGYRRAPVVIRRLLTVGALITWLGTSAIAYALFALEPAMALMAGSLVIATGPTVVSPLLRRVHVSERLHHVLYWEAVLIDAIGIFVVVLCYEWLTPGRTLQLWEPLHRFGLRMFVGVGLGVAAGLIVAQILVREWVPREHTNVFALACAMLTFGVAHLFLTESGVLAVVVAGLVVGLRHPPQLKYARRFQLRLTELGIGVLFVLLAARLELDRFRDPRLLVLLAVVALVLRPLSVWVSTWGKRFGWREKAFLAWIAPRGIIAASMASLFAARLQELGRPSAVHLETITYAVIGVTITLQGLSARPVAHLLGLEQSNRRTWVLVGDSALVTALGRALRRAGVKVVEFPGLSAFDETLDPDDPRFADAQAVLCANTTMLQNVWTAFRVGRELAEDVCYRWATFEPDGASDAAGVQAAGRAVWSSTVTAAAVAEGLESGSHSIELVEVRAYDQQGRFGKNLQPLFWVEEGTAHIIVDPLNPGEPRGDLAIVLRRPVTGLAGLVESVELMDDENLSFEAALTRLTVTAKRFYPDLPNQALTHGILERELTLPTAVGGRMSIPHGYWDGIEKSRCFLGVVPEGIADMSTPDGFPVRLVFLLISPSGNAAEHLESLAALASLGREPEFVELLCRQRVPDRLARLIAERA